MLGAVRVRSRPTPFQANRVAPRAVKQRTFLERAREKKAAPAAGAKKTKFEKTWDPKEEPKDKLEKLAFLWNKVVEKDKPPYNLAIPWKTEDEAPQWFKDLGKLKFEPDVTKLDPLKTGYRYYFKRLSRAAIKDKNMALAAKDFKVLPKRRKQTSP